MSNIFKPSRTVARTKNLIKTYLQTSVFWLIFLMIIPLLIIRFEKYLEVPDFECFEMLGLLMFIVFSLLALWSAYEMSSKGQGTPLPMDCANNLVTSGPYKVWRNPMAVSGIGQGLSIGLFSGSYLVLVYAILGGLAWHLFIKPMEEKDLENRFGIDYTEYKNTTKNWLPKLK